MVVANLVDTQEFGAIPVRVAIALNFHRSFYLS